MSSPTVNPPASPSGLGVLAFKKVVTDTDGKQYLIGEVTNSGSKNQTIEATVLFSKNDGLVSPYYVKYIGTINAGMGIPFKISLQNSSGSQLDPDPSDLKVSSRIMPMAIPSQQEESRLAVDYSTLVMDNATHSISGSIDNKSPSDAYGVTVSAIAIDGQAKFLDVVQSSLIPVIHANSSAAFTLVPLKSIAKQVAYYSCFAGGEDGMNFTLPIGNGQTAQFEMVSEGKIRNVIYNTTTHSIDFDAQGTLLRGAWLGMMFTSGPQPFVDGNFTVLLNGKNATQSLISSDELTPGKYYKHIVAWYPFGHNSVSIVSTSSTVVPEFSAAPAIAVGAIGFAILATRFYFLKK